MRDSKQFQQISRTEKIHKRMKEVENHNRDADASKIVTHQFDCKENDDLNDSDANL